MTEILITRNVLGRLAILIGFAVFVGLRSFAATPSAESDSGGSESSEEELQEEEKVNRLLIVEPRKVIDPELASEQVLKYLESAEVQWRGGDIDFAENYFAAALGIPTDVPEKETVLWRMAHLYREGGMYSKSAAIFERLAQEFPDSRRLPEVYMEVGDIYRKMGAPELAIAKYYMVLNASLNVSFDQLDKYRQLSRDAKMAIAETHKEKEEYIESFEQYQSLFRLDLKPVERLRVHYRMCFLLYELDRHQQAATHLKLFLDEYPDSPHNPEMRYLLAKSYEQLNRKPEALKEVVNILQTQAGPSRNSQSDASYWKQRTGNELANEFYEKGDYRSALTIYQSLARYSSDPAWRWPAIHQIGLCFERLGLPEKAILAYQEILNTEDQEIDVENLSENLKSLRDMAQWRLEHLNWEDDLLARLQILK